MGSTISCVRFAVNQNTLSFHFTQFQANGQVAIQYPTIVQLSNDPQAINGNQVPTQIFFHYLQKIFNVFQPVNGVDPVKHEKIVVMNLDDALKLDDDLVIMSNEFTQRDIYLVVVANFIATYEIRNFYDTLTHNTGGLYMLSANVQTTFVNIILSVITKGDTLRQALLHVKINKIRKNSNVINYINNVNENNQITDGVGDISFEIGFP